MPETFANSPLKKYCFILAIIVWRQACASQAPGMHEAAVVDLAKAG